MKFKIMHENPGRLRVRSLSKEMSVDEADILEAYIKKISGVIKLKIYERTGDAVIYYICDRESLLSALSAFSTEENLDLASRHSARKVNREFEEKIFFQTCLRVVVRYFFPRPLRWAIALYRNLKHIKKALDVLRQKRLEVAVLDAVAITASMLRRDLDTASSVMFLLKIGETLEEWTQKKSIVDLASAMSLGVDDVWLLSDGKEVLTPIDDIKIGDTIVVRTGAMIPMDGKVTDGEAFVNQAYLTGESEPIRKTKGGYVYAGTLVDEGECAIEVTQTSGEGRYDRIVGMIEESQLLRSDREDRASHLADHLVLYSLGGSVLVFLLTRNVTRAVSILMVDFSCALKLAIPLSVLSAMREARERNIMVKGGSFMEKIAQAQTIVFDKTGTLTKAEPTVVEVISFGGNDADAMLAISACLEEHFPHSMAKAVVNAARTRAPHENENHSKVEYVVAHGITSSVNGVPASIGSYHFIFEDNVCVIPHGEQEKFDSIEDSYSKLYFSLGGVLAAVICIRDPLKEGAREVVDSLHKEGFTKVVMMTGDNKQSASLAALSLGLDEVYAEALPEDKAAFIRKEHEAGRTVVMIGDGINDTPALSEADVGIAISEGAAVAREIADVTIGTDNLNALVYLRHLSTLLMERIDSNYRVIMGYNSVLILLGVLGVLPPSYSAMLHNMSTIAISLKSMTSLTK